MTAKIISALLTINASLILAQDFDILVSNEEKRAKVETAPYYSHLGFNSKNMYIKYKFDDFYVRKTFSIGVYDKKTLEKKGEVFYGKDYVKEHKGQLFVKSAFTENKFYFFYQDRPILYTIPIFIFVRIHKYRKDLSIYAETFDNDANLIKKQTKLFTVLNNKRVEPDLFVKYNENLKQIIIGGVLARNKKENVRIEYKLLDENLNTINSGQVDLPITSFSNDAINYTFLDNGLLCVYYKVAEKNKKSKIPSYYLVTVINPKTNDVKTFSFKDDNKYIHDLYIKSKENTIIVAGLCFNFDIAKYQDNNLTNGFIVAKINSQKMDIESFKFISFDRTLIDETFKNSETFNKVNEHLKNKKYPGEFSIKYLNISDLFITPNGDLILETDFHYTFVRTTSSTSFQGSTQVTTYSTNRYTQYLDVTYFKINQSGSIDWAKNISRSILLSGDYVNDIKSYMLSDGKIISFIPGAFDNSSSQESNKNSDFANNLYFFIIDDKNGTLDKTKIKVPNLDNKDKKFLRDLFVDKTTNSIYSVFSTKNDKEINFVKLSLKK